MSIGAIGGLTAAATAIDALAKPQAPQAQPAPQHDADTFNGVPASAQDARAGSADAGHVEGGRVDVTA